MANVTVYSYPIDMIFIPNEILYMIFSYFNFDDGLVMAKVCRQWRNVAYMIITQLPVIVTENSLCDRYSHKFKINTKLLINIQVWLSKVSTIDASAAISSCPILEFCSFCPKLSSLNLSGLDFISNETLSGILISCQSIENLDLSKCYQLSPSALILLSDQLQKLKYLNISQTQLASLSSILYLLNSRGSALVSLVMSQAILLGERDWLDVFDAISYTCTRIEIIDISYNCLLTDCALEKLEIKSRKLELNVKCCDQLSVRGVSDTIKRCYPNLIIHHNARIPDYTPEGIRSYIQYLIGQ